MRKLPFILILLYSFFFPGGSVYGVGEKTLILGAASSWEAVETRRGITEAPLLRPQPVLVLAGGPSESADLAGRESFPAESDSPETAAGIVDLRLSFDEGRPGSFRDSQDRYDVFVSPELAAAPLSRVGPGAALFSGAAKTGDVPVSLKPRPAALFSPGSHIRDFSIEFWLYPLNLENGEQILSWSSSKSHNGAYLNQRIQCVVSKNRLQWNFEDFFFSPGEESRKPSALSGPPALPRTWSHHLIRFDADLGLLEYLVDGKVEAMDYLTLSGREDGDVFTPIIGEDCRLTLGGRFSGMMDEFRIYGSVLRKPTLAKYSSGGRMETKTLDLGNLNSRILKIEASGGRTSGGGVEPRNEYAGNGDMRFSDHGEIRFFARAGGSSFRWNDIPWIPVNPGTELPDTLRGRYIQIAAEFYPGWDGETSPYLSELRVIYRAAEPPPPPSRIFAEAKDGAVELSWRASPSREVEGYLVYYGTAKGEYFGDYAILRVAASVPGAEQNAASGFGGQVRVSPIDVGNRTFVRIEGLDNGTLYYFAVAAYGGHPNGGAYLAPEPGEFSREAAARPLRMAE